MSGNKTHVNHEPCWAYLVRHGATESNLAVPPILQGRGVDGPLSMEGQRQANRTAVCLAQQPVTAVYSSPLRRARETAQAIAEPHNLPVRVIPEITEADVGVWERRSWIEIQETEREAYEAFQKDPAQYGYRGGENLTQVAERVVPAIEDVMKGHAGETIAIVGHNVVNRVFLAASIQLPLAHARSLTQDNCGINLLRFHNGRTKAHSINSIFHLIDD